MRKFILKRLALSVVILFFVSLIIYTILRSMPSSFVETMAREKASLPGGKSYNEWLDQLNASYGLDKGIIAGFIHWLQQAIRGQFGDSWAFNVPVTQKFSTVIWDSFVLGAISFILQIMIAIP